MVEQDLVRVGRYGKGKKKETEKGFEETGWRRWGAVRGSLRALQVRRRRSYRPIITSIKCKQNASAIKTKKGKLHTRTDKEEDTHVKASTSFQCHRKSKRQQINDDQRPTPPN